MNNDDEASTLDENISPADESMSPADENISPADETLITIMRVPRWLSSVCILIPLMVITILGGVSDVRTKPTINLAPLCVGVTVVIAYLLALIIFKIEDRFCEKTIKDKPSFDKIDIIARLLIVPSSIICILTLYEGAAFATARFLIIHELAIILFADMIITSESKRIQMPTLLLFYFASLNSTAMLLNCLLRITELLHNDVFIIIGYLFMDLPFVVLSVYHLTKYKYLHKTKTSIMPILIMTAISVLVAVVVYFIRSTFIYN